MATVSAPQRDAADGAAPAALAGRGFRRLLATRLLSQIADGWFQAALAGSVFFNPERAASAIEITAGFAVLLLPYSALGPFVGVFLDRWSRRSSLAVANLARAALVLPAAICVWLGQYNAVFLVSALLVVALNRFFLAGNSAAIPHVVDAARLVTANSFASTAGTVCYSVSLGAAAYTINLLGTAPHRYAAVSLVGTVCYLASALLIATWFRATDLGPEDALRPASSVLHGVRDTAAGMVAGLRHLGRRPAAGAALLAQAGHRLFYGLLTLTTLLLYRNHYSPGDPEASLTGLIPVAAAAATGALIAALVTPPVVRRLGRAPALVAVTAGMTVLVPSLGAAFVPALTIAGALVVSFGAQSAKIITDTTLQVEVEDDFRGRVFSVNDTGYNICYVTGLFVGSALLPSDGVSVTVMIIAGVGYAMLAAGYALANRRDLRGQRRPRSAAQVSSSASAS